MNNFWSLTIRFAIKNKIYTVLNILGLAIGIAGCFILFGHVIYEKSYDKFNENVNDIYRVHKKVHNNTEVKEYCTVCLEVGQVLSESCPEISEYVRLHKLFGGATIKYKNIEYNEYDLFYADNSILSVFSLKIKEGDSKTPLILPNTIAISESTAKKYFGSNSSVIGQDILVYDRFNGKQLYNITAIFKDIPNNSHVKFDFLLSGENIKNNPRYKKGWGFGNFYTYFRLRHNQKLPDEKITSIINKVEPQINNGKTNSYYLMPLSKIHLDSHLPLELKENGNSTLINLLILISLFIIIIAIVNFNNISTARALERAKEVGIKKVLGASSTSLRTQFVLESVLQNAVSLILAIIIILLIYPFCVNSIGIALPSHVWMLPSTYMLLISIFLFSSILTSVYPAFVLSSFKPISVLKGRMSMSKHGILVRKYLTLFQYVIALILIIGMFAVKRQVQFMMKADLGFSLDNVMIITSPRIAPQESTIRNSYINFRDNLSKNPEINAVASSIYYPGLRILSRQQIYLKNKTKNESNSVTMNWVDYDFVNCYDIKLLEGRNFSKEFNDENSIIVNEAFAKLVDLRVEDMINQEFVYDESVVKVVGVIKNYKHESLRNEVEPIVLYLGAIGRDFISVRFNDMNRLNEKIDRLKSEFNTYFPNNPFDYCWAQDSYNKQYSDDIKNVKTISLFAFLSILVVVLGLIGYSIYFGNLKLKEVCIKKILGSSLLHIFLEQLYNMLRPLLIGTIVAIPIVLWSILKWLNYYAYKMPITVDLFIIPIILLSIIVFITTFYFLIKLALTKPVDVLKNE